MSRFRQLGLAAGSFECRLSGASCGCNGRIGSDHVGTRGGPEGPLLIIRASKPPVSVRPKRRHFAISLARTASGATEPAKGFGSAVSPQSVLRPHLGRLRPYALRSVSQKGRGRRETSGVFLPTSMPTWPAESSSSSPNIVRSKTHPVCEGWRLVRSRCNRSVSSGGCPRSRSDHRDSWAGQAVVDEHGTGKDRRSIQVIFDFGHAENDARGLSAKRCSNP